MKRGVTVLELLVVILCIGGAAFMLMYFGFTNCFPVRPMTEQKMYGYWVALPGSHSAYRLFLTNGGAGLLGARDIYTNAWKITSWHLTNHDILIDLAPITDLSLPPERIRGRARLDEIIGVIEGTNQDGGHWKREMVFYREDVVRQNLAAASDVLTNHLSVIGQNAVTNR